MTAATVEAVQEVEESERDTRKRSKDTRRKPKRQPRYAVVVLNDYKHSYMYVINTLMKVFGYSEQKSFLHAKEIDTQGRSIVWTGTLELAELKKDQIQSAGPDFFVKEPVRFPLGVVLEPLPD